MMVVSSVLRVREESNMVVSEHSLESLSSYLEEASRRYKASLDSWGTTGSTQWHNEEEQRYADLAQTRFPNRPPSPELDAAWQTAALTFREGQTVSGIVTGWNRGGLLVRWKELQGFVPASQLKEMPVFDSDDSRDEKLAHWVGEELTLKLIELDRSRNRLVFSERATMWGPKDGERLLAEIQPGDVRQGHVSNLCDFGAFVDLGGVDGLVHISELSWGRVDHPHELLAIGQPVRIYVISVDRANRRIALSLKRLQPDPWTIVDGRYRPGQTIEATITNVVDFGAFARLEEGLEGLIHISEIADDKIAHPSEVLHPGDHVHACILHIDSANHRLGLSIREAVKQQSTHSESAEQLGTR
jgi:small subunit ribosomal protein S1